MSTQNLSSASTADQRIRRLSAGVVAPLLVLLATLPCIAAEPSPSPQPASKNVQPAAIDPLFCNGFDSAACAFTFIAYGDSRAGNVCDGNAVHLGLVARMAAEPSAFVVNLGDMVAGYDASTNWVQRGSCAADASRGSLKEIIAPLQNRPAPAGVPMAFIPVVGNHDDNWGSNWYPDDFNDGFCSVFNPRQLLVNHTRQPYFSSNHSVSYTDEQFFSLACSTTASTIYPKYFYYSFDYRGTHFVVMRLNGDYDNLEVCNSCGADQSNYDDYYNIHQLDWLRADLTAADSRPGIRNTLVFLHAPLFTTSDGHNGNVSWPRLSKLFSQHRVKMVFSGHNHVYERSHPIFASDTFPNGVRDDANGTVYAITGGGGSTLHGFREATPLMARRLANYHYLRVNISGEQIRVTVIGADGTVLDTFTR